MKRCSIEKTPTIAALKKWILGQRFYPLLMIIFNSIFFCAVLIMVLMSVVITGRITIHNRDSYASRFLQDMRQNITFVTTNVEAYSRFILSEESIQSMLLEDTASPTYKTLVRDARKEVTRLLMEQDYIESLSIYSLDGNGFTAGDGPSYSVDFSVWKEQDWYQEAFDKKGNYLWVHSSFDGIDEWEDRVVFTRVINKTDTMDRIGIMVCILNNQYFTNIISDLNSTGIGSFLIYGEDGVPLFGAPAGNENLQKRLKTSVASLGDQATTLFSGGYLITGCQESHLGWKLICVEHVWTVLENQKTIFLVILMVSFLVMAAASQIYRKLAHVVSQELQNLTKVMERAENQDFQEEIQIEKVWEFIQLGDSYNRLINRIHMLVNEVMQQKLYAKQAQLESLQAQINPHFLYNTLDCISWKAMANSQMEIAEMIQCLSKMFRFSLGSGEKEIALEEEIENIRNYLFLQKKRFKDNLVYLIDIPQELSKYHIMKFLLQPLVENSILHGLQPKTEKGYLGISAQVEEGILTLCVWDNGTGINEEQMEQLLRGNTYDNSRKRHRHGVYNVNERLRMRYGEDSALHFENRKKGGTRVTIRIKTESLQELPK